MTLIVRDLTVRLGETVAVDRVSFEVPHGARVGLIGQSGSGKSVTAMAILGLLPPDAEITGSITWNGREILGLPDRAMARLRGDELGIIFQEPQTALNPVRPIGRQMTEALRIHRGLGRADRRRLAPDLARSVALPDPDQIVRRYPHQLSGGQRQRVGIAMALAAEPALLIADEPTTALDVTVQAGILSLLRSLVIEREMGLLFITHDLAVLAEVATHAVVLEGGRVIETGELRTILQAPKHRTTARLLDDAKATLWRPTSATSPPFARETNHD